MDKDKIQTILERGVEEVIGLDVLKKKLQNKKKLRIK
ncbi:MAG: hypothetical protein RJA90_1398, partial [Bacteroidota bacterium]